MKKKKLVSLVLAMSIGLASLTGCAETTYAQEQVKEEVVEEEVKTEVEEDPINFEAIAAAANKIQQFEEMPEAKEYDPGEHLFMQRFDLLKQLNYQNAKKINSIAIDVPEGYSVICMENFSAVGEFLGTTQTFGFDVWFINNEKVIVEPRFNEAFEHYDYSHAGTVVLEEKEEKQLTK